MDEWIDSLGEEKFFQKLEANAGYLQIEIDDAEKDKTKSTSHHGLY